MGGGGGGRCLLFIMLNFCKINCICKSNTELLGCAKPTAASSVEGRPFAVEANWKCSPAADVSHSVRRVRYWQKSRFLKAIDRLFLVLSCNNTSSFGSLKSCVSVCHLCTGPMSTILALVTPVPPGLLEFVTRSEMDVFSCKRIRLLELIPAIQFSNVALRSSLLL